jgi:hypothetical protein
MIRPFTCLCLLVAAGSGLYLYTAKHDAQMLDREITRLSRLAQDNRSRAALMRAEYDRLGDPERLRDLAAQFLSLQTTDPTQFSSMADLDRRLQAVGAGVQANIGMPTEAPQVVASLAEAPVKAPAVAVPAAAPAPQPERVTAPAPDKVSPASLPERVISERPAPPVQVAVAKPQVPAQKPAPAPVSTPPSVPAAPVQTPSVLAGAQAPTSLAPQPRAPLVRQAAAETRPAPRPAPLPVPARPATVADIAAPAAAPAPIYASALGMARTQAPLPANALTTTSYSPSSLAPASQVNGRR